MQERILHPFLFDMRYSFYNTKRWQKLRLFILDRDGGMCVHCHAKGDTAHHIHFVDDTNYNDPLIIWDPNNIETVCRDCHAAIHSKTGSSATADGYRFDDEGNLICIDEKNF